MSLWGGIASGIGGIASAITGYLGAQQAADAAKSAANMQNRQYQQSRADYEPWRLVGVDSLAKLRDMILNGNQDAYQQSPGYDFRLAEGQKAIERSAAAQGLLGSGATLKALDRYGQDYASGEYGNYLNQLGTLAGYGRQAVADTSQLGAYSAANAGRFLTDAGYLRGTGYANAGNALNQGLNNAIAAYYYNP